MEINADDDQLCSVDITSALEPCMQTSNVSRLENILSVSTSQKSALSLSIADILAQRQLTSSLSDESSLEGMDISDEGLYPSRSISPYDTPPTSHTSGSPTKSSVDENFRPSERVEGTATYVRTAVVRQDQQMSSNESSRCREDLTIPRVIIQSVDDDLPSPEENSLEDSLPSSSSSRLSVSVIPGYDEPTDMIERALFDIRQRSMGFIAEDDDEDDDELGSFEGDISFIRSPAGSRRSGSDHSSEEDNENIFTAYDETYVRWIQDSPYDPDVARRLYEDDDEEDGVSPYPSNLAYFNYSRPMLPRHSEVAFRAIMNEGRTVEHGQFRNYLGAYRENFMPAVSSPLRASHRVSSACSESGRSRFSDGSLYSESQASEAQKMSPSWSNVF